MFASRANQENVIYEQQTAAAAKPLNQGVKGLAPKTPANKAPKTPFKVALNDENATFGGGKTGGQGKQGVLFGEGKSAKVEKNAFVTPAGPRNRAPLGNKTTNAKATAFQTPAALKGPPPSTQEKPSAKPSSPRMRRAKIKIHEAEVETSAAAHQDADEEPEIEHMPPREVPLPDYPDDCWPHDRTYPQFEGRNLTRGWWPGFAAHRSGNDEDEDEEFSDFEEKLKQVKQRERETKEQLARLSKKQSPSVKQSGLQKATRDPLTNRAPQTLKARSAVTALSATSKPAATATAMSKSRLPSTVVASKKVPLATAPSIVGNVRHTAARVASNTTLGYSKGRAVSSTARRPIGDVYAKSSPVADDRNQSPAKTSLDDLFLRAGGLDIGSDGDEDDDLGGGGVPVLLEEDDALTDFQLEPVEI